MRRVLPILGVATALLVVAAAPAQAFKVHATCQGNGTLKATDGAGGSDWAITGAGTCKPLPGTGGQAMTVSFTGAGTSDSRGVCTPGHLLVENLVLNVTTTFRQVASGRTKSFAEVWSSPVSVFPLATPFLVTQDGKLNAPSVAFNRIFLSCGNDGKHPIALFAWTRIDQ